MPDTGAAYIFTANKRQYLAFIKKHLNRQIKMNRSRAKEANIRFNNSLFIESLKTITVNTLFGPVNFYIININILFLLSLKDINRLGIYLNNVSDQLIGRNGITIGIIRKQGHLWFCFNNITTAYFTEVKLRQLYIRFGYLLIIKLYAFLNKAGHNVNINNIKKINKFYYYY